MAPGWGRNRPTCRAPRGGRDPVAEPNQPHHYTMTIENIDAASRLIQAARLLGGRYLQPHDDEALIILPDARTVRFWTDPTDRLRYAELVWPWPGQRPAPVYLPASANANETARAVAALAVRTAALWDQHANQPES